MSLFSRRKGPRTDRADLATLREWAQARRGVEAYVEPPTRFDQTTVVLVAGDGESIRRPVASPQAAADFARKLGIPVYDTNRVGYPQRMRDFNVRKAGGPSSPPPPRPAAPSAPVAPKLGLSPAQKVAVGRLEEFAGEAAADHSPEELRRVWRLARAKSHPDRRGGDRTAWDQVEVDAKTLHLH